MTPRIALVVATYNRERALARLLDRMRAQDLPPAAWELWIAVDGSTDGTADLLAAAQSRADMPLRWFAQGNTGQAGARDAAIARAVAPTVVVIDDDMDVPPTFLSAHAAAVADHPERTVAIGRVVPQDDWRDKPLYEAVREDFMTRLHARLALAREAPTATAFVTQNVSFPRALYLAVGGFDRALRLDEDRELGIRLERAGARFVFAPEAWAVHLSEIGSYEKWRKRQYEYGRYAVEVWRKHGCDVALHPLRNLVNGSRANAWTVGACRGRPGLTRAAVSALRALGEALRSLSFPAGLATHKAIIALEFHQGVADALGGWGSLRKETEAFASHPERPRLPTASGRMTKD
jgi:GT2 family glycosyltransferase